MRLSKCFSKRANKFIWPVSTSFLDFIFSIGINSNILFYQAFFSCKIKRKYFDKVLYCIQKDKDYLRVCNRRKYPVKKMEDNACKIPKSPVMTTHKTLCILLLIDKEYSILH
ncbi:hypothetical protein KIL84_007921 [Mauremys mutica]|uniref:Uncharacterized protein n=1 Tax=Mauremys mutica TaxID=74926 RepID=A0A9D4AVJ1_9SAUR|nr:hypothetical protein KIL84_007921 [Mauremys mutica]